MGVWAQTNEQKWNINVYIAKNDYFGSYSKSLRVFNSFYSISGLQYSRYINPKFDWVVNLNHGVYAFSPKDDDYFITRGYQAADLALRYRFKRLDTQRWSPFLSAGIGARLFTTKIPAQKGTGYDITIPVSAGFDYKLGKNTAFRYQLVLGFTNSNANDGNLQTEGTLFETDFYLQNSFGFTFYIGKSNGNQTLPKTAKVKIEDRDKDGIPDNEDECPDIAAKGTFNGCPLNDRDGDGVLNDEDNCPDKKGETRFMGCTDSDNDGVSDFYDKCPDIKGKLTSSGCPDSDNDGVAEDKDKCPTVPGLAVFNGCPDTDKDSVPDYLDNCPNQFGLKQLNGCPDLDKDGVADINDKCPEVFGLANLDGCPEIKQPTLVNENLKKLVKESRKGIQFETGSAVLKPSSYIVLDKIAGELVANPQLKFVINGHTDNKGNPAKNLVLSKNRAKSVANYLISKGIDAKRITSNGFGGSKPIAQNTTEAGRALNRRVDLIIK